MAALTIEDRMALRSLVDAYADAVDRKDPPGVAALFLPEGRLVVPDPADPVRRVTVRTGRGEIISALGRLRRYRALTHVVGGQVLADTDTDTDRADRTVTGVTSCLANHAYEQDGRARLLVMGIHYHDTYGLEAGVWRFAARRLEIGWRDDRPLGEGAP
jgi:hypothetical protein